MRIATIHVESFDALRDLRHEFQLPPVGGLVVLEGPNEAGKTTMLRFIQSLLFGNGELHGTLILEEEGQKFILRQSGRRQSLSLIEMATGNTLDGTKLNQMLGGLDAKVYRSVFAFGLDELQQLQFLAASGVQEHIFSASVAGAGRNARKALTRIDRELKELLKPRANAVLNDLADELTETKRAVRDAWQANRAYEDLKRQESDLFAEIGRTQQDLVTGEAAQRRLDAIIELWPVWSNASEAAWELASTQEITDIPIDSLSLFDVAMEQAEEYQLDIEAQETDLERDEAELATIAVGSDLLALKPQIEEAFSFLGTQQQRLKEGIPSVLDRLDQQRQRLEQQLQQLEGDWDQQSLTAVGATAAPPERLLLDEPLLEAASDIEVLYGNLSAYSIRKENCAALEQKIRVADGQLKVLIGELGTGWDEDKVAGFDQGSGWRQKATETAGELARLRHARDQLDARYNLVQTRSGEAMDRLAGLPAPQLERTELEASGKQLQEQVQGYLGLQAGVADRNQKGQSLQARLAGLATAEAEALRGRPLRWTGPVVGALGLLAAAYFSFPTSRAGAYALAALALAVLVLLRPREPLRGIATFEEIEQQLAVERAELVRLDEQVRADLVRLDLAMEPGAGEMQELLNAAQNSLKRIEANLAALDQHALANASALRVTDELDDLRRHLAELDSERGFVRAAWTSWCAEQRIPDSFSPKGLDHYLARVEEAVRLSRARAERGRELSGLLKAVQAYEAKIEQLRPQLCSEGATEEPSELVANWRQRLEEEQERKRQLGRWHQQIRDASAQLDQVKQTEVEFGHLTQRSDDWEENARWLLERAGRPVSVAGLGLLTAVRELNTELLSAEADANRATRLQEACDEHEAALEDMRARQDKRKEAANGILAAAGAANRPDLEQRLAIQERREEFERIVSNAETQLTAHFGQYEEEARAVLDEKDPIEWSSRRDAAEAELDARQGRLHGKDGLWARHAQTVEELRTLESSSDIAEQSAQLENLQQELRAEARNWLVLKLAEDMIADNLKEYERTHVPDVLKHASEKLSAVTGGRYVRIHNTQSSALRVFTSDDEVLDAAQLSRGTQEQLYLAVRLGLIDHFAKQSGKLPIVMDDVLVNADPERAVQLADVLAEAASRHQIIYLTCHPHIATLLRDRVPGCSYVKLHRLDAKGFDDVELLPAEVGSHAAGSSRIGVDVLLSQVLQVLEDAYPQRLARGDIMSEIGITSYQFTRVINELQDSGHVDKQGQRRTTTYAAVRSLS